MHERANQFFYIISGIATLIVDECEYELNPNEGLQVPSGAKHRLENKQDSDLVFLVISSPPSHGDRVNL